MFTIAKELGKAWARIGVMRMRVPGDNKVSI